MDLWNFQIFEVIVFVLAKISNGQSSKEALFLSWLALITLIYNAIWLTLHLFSCKWTKTINFLKQIDFCVSVIASLAFMLSATLLVPSSDGFLKTASVSRDFNFLNKCALRLLEWRNTNRIDIFVGDLHVNFDSYEKHFLHRRRLLSINTDQHSYENLSPTELLHLLVCRHFTNSHGKVYSTKLNSY